MANGQKIGKVLTLKIENGFSYLLIPDKSIPELAHYVNLLEKDLKGERELSQNLINNLDTLFSSIDLQKIVFDKNYEFLTTEENFREIEQVYPFVKGEKINRSINVHLDEEDVKVLFYGFCDLSQRVLEKHSQNQEEGGKK